MSTLQFKTSLKCGGCVKAITPAMDEIEGITSWSAELASLPCILSVEADTDVEQEVTSAVKNAGYSIEKLS